MLLLHRLYLTITLQALLKIYLQKPLLQLLISPNWVLQLNFVPHHLEMLPKLFRQLHFLYDLLQIIWLLHLLINYYPAMI